MAYMNISRYFCRRIKQSYSSERYHRFFVLFSTVQQLSGILTLLGVLACVLLVAIRHFANCQLGKLRLWGTSGGLVVASRVGRRDSRGCRLREAEGFTSLRSWTSIFIKSPRHCNAMADIDALFKVRNSLDV
jgi:hypothetical protein